MKAAAIACAWRGLAFAAVGAACGLILQAWLVPGNVASWLALKAFCE